MPTTLTLASATFAAGKFGQALSAGNGSATLNPGSSFTAEAWIYPTSYPSGGGISIALGFDNGLWAGIDSSGALAMAGGGAASKPTVSLNTWHHLVVDYDGSNFSTYFDGNRIDHAVGGFSSSTGAFRVGNFTYGSSVNAFPFLGMIDEVAVWTGIKYGTSTYTVPNAAYSGNETNLFALYHLDGNGTDSVGSGSSALIIGGLSAAPNSTAIVLSLSAALSGGSGSGYTYKIYRGATPDFIPASGTLLASVSAMPYSDASVTDGSDYYYGVVGVDGAGATVNAVPAGTASLASSPSTLLYVSGQRLSTPRALVFIGDSITAGAGISPGQAPPAVAAARLAETRGRRSISFSNQGVSGTTTGDWQPGSGLYNSAKSAMQGFAAASPTPQLVFSVMLGTNDSQAAVALSSSAYKASLKNIVDALIADFPAARVVLHMAPWYSPNTKNSATYEQAGLARLASYKAALTSLISDYAGSFPGSVFLGDFLAFPHFAQKYQSEMQGENGGNGIFYLHPNSIGAASLGELQASAIERAFESRKFTVVPA